MEKLIEFLKEKFPNGIQMFDSRNTAGDSMTTIYKENGITVDHCHHWEYIEIFGLTHEQFKEVMSKIRGC